MRQAMYELIARPQQFDASHVHQLKLIFRSKPAGAEGNANALQIEQFATGRGRHMPNRRFAMRQCANAGRPERCGIGRDR